MIISVNWLKKFTDIDVSIDELVTLIGARLVEVESVVDLGDKYKDVVIARVITAEDVPESDHLHLCMIDDGGVVEGIERNESGYVQVVCGASNVRAGILVAWLPPKSVVPDTYGSGDPFVLESRKLRGFMSNGMIASARELDLYDEHDGILEIDIDVTPGASFAKTYELDDYLLDIENKSLTHRPDCFGIIGFAREIAAIQGKTFTTPDWLKNIEPTFDGNVSTFDAPKVTIDDPSLSNRYQAVVISGSNGTAKSPLLTQTYLARVGMRPISAIVDVTNYLMMTTGQPLHAFDYDKLLTLTDGLADIHVRGGREDEKLKLLDGREISLAPEDIVIANGEVAVALAGAMGGSDTEIDESTTNIMLESATFNLYNLRTTQMRHGIFSEAITRFTKGQPAELTAPVLGEAVRMMGAYGGKQSSDIGESYPGKHDRITIRNSMSKSINSLLGVDMSPEQVADTLERVEFETDTEGSDMIISHTPYWRTDIHISEDVTEEVGRLNGFDNIKPTLPLRDFTGVMPTQFDKFRGELRDRMARSGANEVLTYSFVHSDLLKKVGQNPAMAYRIVNAISPELQYYRLSILPSLLDKVNMNMRQKFDEFALFEIGKVHVRGVMDEVEPDVPAEFARLDAVLVSKVSRGAAYYRAKRLFESAIGTSDLIYQAFSDNDNRGIALAPFEPKRSAIVLIGQQKIGVVGEFKSSVRKSFKLPDYSAGFSLDLDSLYGCAPSGNMNYSPISRYPSTERDICFQVSQDTRYAEIVRLVKQRLDSTALDCAVVPVDIYQPAEGDTKNVTVRVKLTAYDRTLTGDETDKITQSIIDNVVNVTGATVI